MAFYKDFETIYGEMVTDHENVHGTPPGLLSRVLYSVLAFAVWGLYRYQRWIADQAFPDTCESRYLDKHAARRGVTRQQGEADAALLSRLASVEQEPPAGGNKYDWPRWAKETTHVHNDGGDDEWTERVKAAWCFEHERGVGSINVVITADLSDAPAWANATAYSAGDIVSYGTEQYVTAAGGTSSGTNPQDDTGVTWTNCTEEPTDDLVAAVETCLEAQRPLGVWDFEVIAATKTLQDVTMTVSGNVDTDTIESDIDSFLRFPIDRTLYVAQLISIAIERGATDASVSTPSGSSVTVTTGPTTYERIWPGTISIS